MRLQQTDDEWPLTRPGEQAIPLERHPNQPIHTWFAGLAGYRAALREYLASSGGDLNDWWNHDTSLVQFLGFDCAYSHVIAYASQLALEQTGPSKLFHFTNRFLQLDGKNFSTSRGHAVWIRDISAKYPVDAVRLYASLYAPEDEVKDFRLADFEKWVGEWYVPKVAHGTWTRIDADRSVAFAKDGRDQAGKLFNRKAGGNPVAGGRSHRNGATLAARSALADICAFGRSRASPPLSRHRSSTSPAAFRST
jgi:hypothetical protein